LSLTPINLSITIIYDIRVTSTRTKILPHPAASAIVQHPLGRESPKTTLSQLCTISGKNRLRASGRVAACPWRFSKGPLEPVLSAHYLYRTNFSQ
jgi:hypothetical protein